MTFYFMGGEVGSFTPSDGDSYESTSEVGYDSNFARCGMVASAGASSFESFALTLPDDFWIHCEISRQNSSSATSYPLVLKTGGTEVFRLACTSSAIQMQALIAAVWTNVGASVATSLGSTARQTVDIFIEGNDASGTTTLYLAGTERTTATPDMTSVASIDAIHCDGSSNTAHGLSQVIVADEPTIGMKLGTRTLSGAGANTAWTGDYTGVDEVRYTDADFIYSSAADQIETFTTTGGALTGYVVRAVGVYCRARRGASGPQNLQLALRVNGTNYFSGSKALDLGYESYGHIWEDNPDTTVDWLVAAIANIEPGVKSIT